MNKQKRPQPKPASLTTRINTVKAQLQDMQEYKRLMAEDGIEPDTEDKARESRLILLLMRLERELTGQDKPSYLRRIAGQKKAAAEAGEQVIPQGPTGRRSRQRRKKPTAVHTATPGSRSGGNPHPKQAAGARAKNGPRPDATRTSGATAKPGSKRAPRPATKQRPGRSGKPNR